MEDAMGKLLVPDELWALVEPILPKHPYVPGVGKPRVPDRVCLTGILFVLKTGGPLGKLGEVMGDRASDSDPHRMTLSCRGIASAIARRGQPHGSGLGIFRYVVEQALALFHQFRRLRTRFDKRDDIHEAFMSLGCSMMCWRRLHN